MQDSRALAVAAAVGSASRDRDGLWAVHAQLRTYVRSNIRAANRYQPDSSPPRLGTTATVPLIQPRRMDAGEQ